MVLLSDRLQGPGEALGVHVRMFWKSNDAQTGRRARPHALWLVPVPAAGTLSGSSGS